MVIFEDFLRCNALFELVSYFMTPGDCEGSFPPNIYIYIYPGSPADQTKWLVFRMIHGARIPDPTNGQSLVGLDFLGIQRG